MQLCLLLWNLLTHLAGIYLFTRGFLLTRLSLPNISSPVDFPAHQSNFSLLNASLTHSLTSRANSLPPLQTHTRAIFLLIDSLRFDFISPHPPTPPSPYHHNVLTLPRDLTATRPRHSFIFNAYSDPPTTTLQRIKALMTGTLPTFVDIGGSFGAAGGGGDNENRSEVAEDSVLKQMNILGKKIAFMGDDTWLSVFPSSFAKNLTFPFDSFNVEDLHTVDEGVISHLFPLLESTSSSTTQPKFDLLIAHFLGVDHVGHRLGPDHPSMKHKLQQMNEVLKRVVDRMDASTLLIVLGDHGMDRSGDHGGDGVLETSAGMWVYSKGPALMNSTLALPDSFLTYQTFPGTSIPHRSVQQIDILPSLSLLLGLPIPYNNLGTVIPELFWRDRKGRILEKALEANARQVWRFLETYRGSRLGGELDEVWEGLVRDWEDTQAKVAKEAAARALFRSNKKSGKVKTLHKTSFSLSLAFLSSTRRALSACRAIWAQFNPLLMSLGLTTLAMCLIACWRVYVGYSATVANAMKRMADPDQGNKDKELEPDRYLSTLFLRSLVSSLASALLGGVFAYFGLAIHSSVSLPHWIVFFASLGSSAGLILHNSPPKPPRTTQTLSLRALLSSTGALSSLPIILILHSLTFVSNSFTFWEDRLLPFLLLSSLIPYLRLSLHPALFSSSSPSPLVSPPRESQSQSQSHPKARVRNHLLLCLALFAFSIRLMALSTVCREEQQPYCRVTFYQASSVPQPPWVVLLVLIGLFVMAIWVMAGFDIPRKECRFLRLGRKISGERDDDARQQLLDEEVDDDSDDDDDDFNAKRTRSHLRYVFIPTLIAGTLFWLLEWVDSAGLLAFGGVPEDASSASVAAASLPFMGRILTWLLRSLEDWLGRDMVLGMETGTTSSEDLRTWRTYIAWVGVLWCLGGGGYAWVCWWWGRRSRLRGRGERKGFRTKRIWGSESTQPHSYTERERVPSRALARHTPYMILWTTFFGLAYICAQLTGQVVLLLSAVALLSFGEVMRCARIARGWVGMYEAEQEREVTSLTTRSDTALHLMKKTGPSIQMFKFTDLTPITLLSLLTFYATGHQANVPSIQWKAAFVLCEQVQYPLSVATMVLNELGGVGVVVLGIGLIIIRLRGDTEVEVKEIEEEERIPTVALSQTMDTLFLSLLSLSMHFLVLLLGSSIGAAILRRHLMVWKVFAPRFMAAVVEVFLVDLAVLGVGLLELF